MKIKKLILVFILIIIAGNVFAGITERVSISSDGEQANYDSYSSCISGDGRYVAFVSVVDQLPDDMYAESDVFVHDRQAGKTELVSISSDGTKGYGDSQLPSISSDGRYIAFQSNAENLVFGDFNYSRDVFVHDMKTGETKFVSVSSNGDQANNESFSPSISANGRFVTFVSSANNLISNDTNERNDVFVHDIQTGGTELVSVSSQGIQGDGESGWPSISADGRFIAFTSSSINLSAIANSQYDIYVHDRLTGNTELISKSICGTQSNGSSNPSSISADGRFVAFSSTATDLVEKDTNNFCDIFIYDMQSGKTELVSIASDGVQANNNCYSPSISADGRFVAFETISSNLIMNDTNLSVDIFVHDRLTNSTVRASLASDGTQCEPFYDYYDNESPSISANGEFVAFSSYAYDLVINDTNNCRDIFVSKIGISVTDVILNKTLLSLNKGESESLIASIKPYDTANKAVKWESSNTSIATVDDSGKVTAVSVGNCNITVTTIDGEKTSVCTVIVESLYITSPKIVDIYETNSKTISIKGKCSAGFTKISFFVNDLQSQPCKINNGNWSASKVELQLGYNGISVVGVTKDKQTFIVTMYVYYLDNTSPSLAISKPISKGVYTTAKKDIIISGIAKDDDRIYEIYCQNNTTGSTVYNYVSNSWKILVPLYLGDNNITISVYDRSGNSTESSIQIIRQDKTKPTLKINSPTLKSTYKTNKNTIDLSGTASDNDVLAEVSWKNSKTGKTGVCYGKESWSVENIGLHLGSNPITIIAKDASGNITSKKIVVDFKLKK